MYEAFNTVDRYDRNIVLISIQKLRIRIDIDLFNDKFFPATSALDRRFCLVAKVTTRTRVDDHFEF